MCWWPVLYHCTTWRDRFATSEGGTFRQFGWMCYPFHPTKHNDTPFYPHSKNYKGRKWRGGFGFYAFPRS